MRKKTDLYHMDCTVFDAVYSIYVVFDFFDTLQHE